MKRSTAWRRLARIIETSEPEFLCIALGEARFSCAPRVRAVIPSYELRQSMIREIKEDLTGVPDPGYTGPAFNEPNDPEMVEERPLRVLACLLFAARAEAEGE